MGEAARIYVRIDALTAGLTSGLAAADGKLKGFATSAGRMGRTMTKDLTLPILGVGVAATKMALTFDDKMRQIQTQAGASGREVAKMHDKVLGLAKVTGVGGPAKLADALYRIESAGIRGSKAFEMLTASAHLAEVGHSDLEQTTYALVAAQKSGVAGAQNFGQAIGYINAIVGGGNMHMQDLTSAFGTFIPAVAKATGISLPEFGAALDVFTNRGKDATSSATGLVRAFSQMAAPTKAASKSLADMGIGSTQLARDMASGGLVKAINDLKAHFSAMPDRIRATQDLLNAFGRSKGGAQMLVLVQAAKELGLNLDTIKAKAGGFGQALAATQNEAAVKIQTAWSSIQASLVRGGEVLAPIAAKVAQFVAGVLQGFQSLSPTAQRFIMIGAGIVAALGPIVSVAGRVASALRGLGGAMQFVANNPIRGGIFAGLLVAAGLAATAAVKLGMKWEETRNAFNDARNAILALRGSLDALKGAQDGVSQANINLMRDRAVATQSERTWQQVVAEGKTKTVEGALAYTEMRQSLQNVRMDTVALTAAHKAENAELAKRAEATQRTEGKIDTLRQKLASILGMKDPLGHMLTGSVFDPSSWTALGSSMAHPIAAFEGFLNGMSKTDNVRKASTELFKLAASADRTTMSVAKSDPAMAKASNQVSLYATAIGFLINKYGQVPNKKQIVAEIKLMKADGWDARFAQLMREGGAAGTKTSTAFLAGAGKIVQGTTAKVAQTVRAIGKAAGAAEGQGRLVGAAGGRGIAEGLQSQIGNIAAQAAATVRTAMAQAGAMAHGSGPWHFTIHEVGKPLMEGVAEGIKGMVGQVAAAMSGTLAQAVSIAHSVTVGAALVGQGMAARIAEGFQQKQQTVAQQVRGAMMALVTNRPELTAASKVLGETQARAIAAGIVGYQPTLAQQVKTALRDAMKQAMDAAKQVVTTDLSNMLSQFDSFASSVTSAFDTLTSANNPFAKQLKDMQAADQAKQLADSLSAAVSQRNADVNAGPQSGETQDQFQKRIAADEAAVVAAQRAIDEAQVQQQATDWDAQRKAEKNALERRLAQLRTELRKHPGEYKKIHKEIVDLLQKFGIDYGAVMAASDFNMADGLRKNISAVVQAAKELAQAIVKELRIELDVKIKTGGGSGLPPTFADGGVFNAVPGGMYRFVEAGHSEAVIPLDPAKRGRAMGLIGDVMRRVRGFADGGFYDGGDGAPPYGDPTLRPGDPVYRTSAGGGDDAAAPPGRLNDTDYAAKLREGGPKWPGPKRWDPGEAMWAGKMVEIMQKRWGDRLHVENAAIQAVWRSRNTGLPGALNTPPNSLADATFGQVWYDFPGTQYPDGWAWPPKGKGLPAFGDGGIVTKPTVALVGEKGAEAIVPFDKIRKGQTAGPLVSIGEIHVHDEVDVASVQSAIGRGLFMAGMQQ